MLRLVLGCMLSTRQAAPETRPSVSLRLRAFDTPCIFGNADIEERRLVGLGEGGEEPPAFCLPVLRFLSGFHHDIQGRECCFKASVAGSSANQCVVIGQRENF